MYYIYFCFSEITENEQSNVTNNNRSGHKSKKHHDKTKDNKEKQMHKKEMKRMKRNEEKQLEKNRQQKEDLTINTNDHLLLDDLSDDDDAFNGKLKYTMISLYLFINFFWE